ncbi:septation protein SepH [Xylanimonas oleitrophica]|nr:septation protein SepH [Xylanimonas oleitrophica]
MAELELVRVQEDGEHLVLRDPDGTEHSLPVTDALRDAVVRRRDAARRAEDDGAPAPVAAPEPALRPRDLQARLRAGATAEELATEAGVDVEHVRRYEWPVMAERDHVIGMVRAHEVVGLDRTTALGDVADARLAARGVGKDDATWSARREGNAPWVVEVRFSAGDRERRARWTFDLRGRVVTPLDDEARWLGQPDDPLSPEMHGVPSLAARRPAPAADDETALLLDDLAGRRGQRPARARRQPTPTSATPVVGAAGDAPVTGATPAVPPQLPTTEDGTLGPAPLGDLPVRERTPGHGDDAGAQPERAAPQRSLPDRTLPTPPVPEPEPVAQADDSPGASVVDLGRWNPRRTRDRSVSPGAGVGALQPTLLSQPEVEGRHMAPSQTEAQTSHSEETPGPAGDRPHDPAAAHPSTGAGLPSRSGTREVPARRSRKGRAQVPSWDEIVFGARPEH